MTEKQIHEQEQERKRNNMGSVATKKYPGKRAYHKGCFGSSPIQKLNKTGGKK